MGRAEVFKRLYNILEDFLHHLQKIHADNIGWKPWRQSRLSVGTAELFKSIESDLHEINKEIKTGLFPYCFEITKRLLEVQEGLREIQRSVQFEIYSLDAEFARSKYSWS